MSKTKNAIDQPGDLEKDIKRSHRLSAVLGAVGLALVSVIAVSAPMASHNGVAKDVALGADAASVVNLLGVMSSTEKTGKLKEQLDGTTAEVPENETALQRTSQVPDLTDRTEIVEAGLPN
ncbi:MAG: hypothetical protein LBM73_00675 [Candidatus Nomurabacteria bacterium]|jgi:hypothetical protein|nr:hypothetical protein [Candidatus Nomurabacteria bacterium]